MTNREQRRLQQSLERRQAKQDQSTKGRAAARATAARTAPRTASDKNVFQRLVQFLQEVRNELRRVSWPTRAQMVAFTTVVLITSTAITAFVYGLDQAFRAAVLGILGAN